MLSRIGQFISVSLLLLLLVSCGTPFRDNPADPGSSAYSPHSVLTLQIHTANRSPIAMAQVSLAGRTAFTDNNGIALLSGLAPGTYWVSVTRAQFGSLDTSLTLAETNSTHEIVLNGLPQFIRPEVISIRYDGLVSTLPSVLFSVKVSDPDGIGTIQSVWATCLLPGFTFGRFSLSYAGDSLWQVQLDTLPGSRDPVNLVGWPMQFFATDRIDTSLSASIALERVFSGYPEINYPREGTVDTVRTFAARWKVTGSGDRFDYTFRLIIFGSNGLERYRRENLPRTDSVASLVNVVTPGNYSMEVHEVDAFGNYSRSIRKNFTLVP